MNASTHIRRTLARAGAIAFLIAGAWLAPATGGAETPATRKSAGTNDAPRALELEVPDDPPARLAARDDPGARSPLLRVAFGPYESVQVNVDALGQNIVGDAANEPSIAVNPTNPLNMVVGWRQFDSVTSNFRQAGWAFTFDGGRTWTFPGVLQPGVFRSDPVLDADSHGNFYYQSLKQNFTADVYKSINGGVTWQAPVAEFGGDKNWLVVDRSGGASDGFLYGIWQRFAACCGTNVLTRSTNGAASFQSPVPVTNSPTFGTLAVGPAGELYATGIDGSVTQDFSHYVVAKSTNAANPAVTPTFTGGRVDLGGSMAISAGPNPGGLLGQPYVSVDRSTGPGRGNVYVGGSVAGSDPLDAKFIRSADGGSTWTAPVRVNDDASNANWQWFAASSVAPNGRIDMIWNDTRNTGQASLSQLFYSYSWDGGTTWAPNVPVSPVFDSTVGYPNQNKIGDYDSIVSNATGADVAYTATFNGEQDVFYLRVFPDCNDNGISDVTDVTGGTSADCNANHIPDECDRSVCGPSAVYESSAPAATCAVGGPGSANGYVDPGEDVVLAVTLRNNGNVPLTGVAANLATATPGVTVTRASAGYPDIAPQTTASSLAPHFAFTVGTQVPCGTLVEFTLAVSAAQGSWARAFTVRVGGPGSATITYDATDVPKTIEDNATTNSFLTIADPSAVLDADVTVTLAHTDDSSVVLTLIAPNASRITLSDREGGSGADFAGTVFDDEATTPISAGQAPFTGRFKPETPLSVIDGFPAHGTWRLEVQDTAALDTGTLTAWSLTATTASGFACEACPVPVPTLAPEALRFSPGPTTLAWDAAVGASYYVLYRGDPASLPDLLTPLADSCRRLTTTGTSTGDVLDEVPPAGSFFWYLVRAATGAGEGPAGDATAGPRSQESAGACP